jgi:predicted nuclease of predicted toxin-antitoxin system
MARYIIDANLPRYISHWNSGAYMFAVDLGESISDQEIWDHAIKHELTIVSKDADFSNRVLLSTTGPSVIHFKLGNMRLRQFRSFLDRNWIELCQMSSKYRLIVVYDDRVECVS